MDTVKKKPGKKKAPKAAAETAAPSRPVMTATDRIKAKVRSLEEIAEEVDVRAKDVCARITAETVSVEERVKGYLASIGKADVLGSSLILKRETSAFSQITPDITFTYIPLSFIRGREAELEWMETEDKRKQLLEVTNIIGDYKKSLEAIAVSLRDISKEQSDAYIAILNTTVIGVPFSQKENQDVAIIYVYDPKEEELMRVVAHLRADTHEPPHRSGFEADHVLRHQKEFIRELKKEAKNEKATIYVVDNFSDKVPGPVRAGHALSEIQKKYDAAHPDVVKEREEAINHVAQLGTTILSSLADILMSGIERSIDKASSGSSNVTRTADGTPIAFNPNGGEVPEGTIDELMRAHKGDEIIPKDMYEGKCPNCPGSAMGCEKYEQAKRFYESSPDGTAPKPILH